MRRFGSREYTESFEPERGENDTCGIWSWYLKQKVTKQVRVNFPRRPICRETTASNRNSLQFGGKIGKLAEKRLKKWENRNFERLEESILLSWANVSNIPPYIPSAIPIALVHRQWYKSTLWQRKHFDFKSLVITRGVRLTQDYKKKKLLAKRQLAINFQIDIWIISLKQD